MILLFAILLSACAAEPTAAPTEEPMEAPTEEPMEEPTEEPMEEPTEKPMEEPTEEPAEAPTEEPMEEPVSEVIVPVTPAGQAQTTFTRNFNPFVATPLFPTKYGVYEVLLISNNMTGEIVPWLATEYQWSDDLLTLTFTLREGVKWSDGTDFTAADVAYTFNLLKSNSALQGTGLAAVGEGGYVDSVTAPDDLTVAFAFNKVYTPGLYDLIKQSIVPEHVWSEVDDPVVFTNDNPVGTGPFTEIVNYQDQVYEVHRNPHYWGAPAPYVQGFKMLGFSGNDTAATMFVNGDTHWTGQFFPNWQEAVVAKNPEDLHCWWPTVTSDQMFMMNHTKKPFDDVVMRKAISMAFNREQLIEVAIQGTSTPGDVTALSSGYAAWKVEDPTTLADWTRYDPDASNQMLDEAGYALDDDGYRTNPDGSPIEVELLMVNGFTDWLAIAPLMKQQLEAIGLNVVINSYDVPVAFDKWFNGTFDMSLFFGMAEDTPYAYYRRIMSTETVVPVGEPAAMGVNMWRYGNEKADAALEKFATTGDFEVQKEAALELQQIMADEAPILSMWHAPAFYCYNDSLAIGWPSADDPYAMPMPISGSPYTSQLIVLTTLKGK
jgi:peptide/nickel transport system substrate-binding protein